MSDAPSPTVVISSVEREPNKLVIRQGGLTRFVHLPVQCLHRAAQDGVVTVVLHSNNQGGVHLLLSENDQPSLGVVDALPAGNRPEVVMQVLAAAKQPAGAPARRLGAPVVPEEPGRIEYDGQVITVVAGDQHFHFRPDDVTTPVHVGTGKADDGDLVVELEFGDRTRRRIKVAAPALRSTERALLFLRKRSGGTAGRSTALEYKIVKNMLASSLEEQLNALGRDGWELVAMTGLDGVMTLTGNKLLAVLKRPRRGR